MTHDERLYPDPDSFKPERFFASDGELNDDDMMLAFGFGRRSDPCFSLLLMFFEAAISYLQDLSRTPYGRRYDMVRDSVGLSHLQYRESQK